MTRNRASARPNPEKIAKVKDLFPQYGGGFIEKCLHYFGSDPNDVIIAFLENNLPPHLSNPTILWKIIPVVSVIMKVF